MRVIRFSILAWLFFYSLCFAQDNYLSYTIGAPGNINEVAITGDVGTDEVKSGGIYQYTIPIEVPPGPRGIAPSFAIVYAGEGFGWLGKGWSLSTPSVTRDFRMGMHLPSGK